LRGGLARTTASGSRRKIPPTHARSPSSIAQAIQNSASPPIASKASRLSFAGPAIALLPIIASPVSIACAPPSPIAPPQPAGSPDTVDPRSNPSAIPIRITATIATISARPKRLPGTSRTILRPPSATIGSNRTAPSPNNSMSKSLA
jgi:hypothetical protein